MKLKRILLILTIAIGIVHAQPLNSPYPKKDAVANTLYSSFAEPPKTLDPARSYSSNEYTFIAQIYEPPLQYDYLLRPYKLIPLTAVDIPKPRYYNKNKQLLPDNASDKSIAYSLYTVKIKPGIYYQPHPAFAKNAKGEYLYHDITTDFLERNDITQLFDFDQTGTRELTAADYVYQIKRLAHPESQSPILGLMSDYIEGLSGYSEKLAKAYQQALKKDETHAFVDLRKHPLESVKEIDRYTYQIKIKGKYPQFIYWLAMPFFAPMPWEVDRFDSQPGMEDHNLTINWYPVGTGPYMLTENNPNAVMVMKKNPNFHIEKYPTQGEPGDREKGLLVDAGKTLPFIDTLVFSLEKESIPRWNKFLQGYYDTSGISSDSFDQAIHVDEQGRPHLTESMKNQGIKLYTSVVPSSFYIGFNMMDDVVGGSSERARKLRQAISIALDYEEFISIFFNGRGIVAQGPIPPGIFGYQKGTAGVNPIVYTNKNAKKQRRSIVEAKRLLAEAGYPNGRDIKTGKPLVLNFDVPAGGGPDDKARFDWMRKQYAKIGIQLNIRSTQYNRFQRKMRDGNAQIFQWGWNADYPDPENFLFLLYGPNGKVKHGGENAANYNNPEYNRLFEKMKNMPNGPERLAIIKKMTQLVQTDAPWIFGFHPKNFVLSHKWNRISKPNAIANNTVKYARLNPVVREEKRIAWNKPISWPIGLVLFGLFLSTIPVYMRYRFKEHHPREREDF